MKAVSSEGPPCFSRAVLAALLHGATAAFLLHQRRGRTVELAQGTVVLPGTGKCFGNFWYLNLLRSASVYRKRNQQSVRRTGCYFVCFSKQKAQHIEKERVCQCVCVRCACVHVCARARERVADKEGDRMFATQ